MNLNVDLNSLPAEASQSSQPPRAAGSGGDGGAPIDVEASEDELQLLLPPRGFPQV